MDTQFQQEIVKRKAKTQIPIPETRLVNGEVYVLFAEFQTKQDAEKVGDTYRQGKYDITATPEGYWAVYILLPGTKRCLQMLHQS